MVFGVEAQRFQNDLEQGARTDVLRTALRSVQQSHFLIESIPSFTAYTASSRMRSITAGSNWGEASVNKVRDTQLLMVDMASKTDTCVLP